MELKAYKVGSLVTYLPAINGNRSLPAGERIEADLLPMSNGEREAFGQSLLTTGQARAELVNNVAGKVSDVLTARVVALRGLMVAGRAIPNGATLCALQAQYNSQELSDLIVELLTAVQNLSILEPGLLKNFESSPSI